MIRSDFLGKSSYDGCVGCGIISGDFYVPNGIIYENNSFVLHQDPEIPIESFFIITSKRHFKYLYEMTDTEYIDYTDILRVSRIILKKINRSNEYTIITEERSNHFHTWMFPRLEWMEGFSRSLSDIRNIMNYSRNNMIEKNNIQNVMNIVEKAKAIL